MVVVFGWCWSSIVVRWVFVDVGGAVRSWVDSDDSASSLSDDVARQRTCLVVVHLPYQIADEDDRCGGKPLTCTHRHRLDDVARTVDVPRRRSHEPSTRRGLGQPLGAGDVALPPRCRRGWYVPSLCRRGGGRSVTVVGSDGGGWWRPLGTLVMRRLGCRR